MDLLQLQSDPSAFRASLLIDTDSGPKPFADCVDDWQARDFAAMDDGWRRAAGQQVQAGCFQRAWLERPRGHSKTLDIAIMVAWLLFASRKRLSGIAAAGDEDQARLLRDAVGKLVHCNPWLARVLEVQSARVINTHTESALDVIPSDAPSSYGLTPDVVVCDEVCHWKKRDLWDSLLSSAAKRATCVLIAITNAGMRDDWVWTLREAIRQDSARWYFSRLESPCAAWITPDRLAEQERLLPPTAYRRLWLNEWANAGGDALSEADIRAAFVPGLAPLNSAAEAPGFDFVAGCDAGVSRDASALVILGIRRDHAGHGTIRLAATRIWRPAKGSKVDLGQVESALVDCHARFNLRTINLDPWELRYLASRLQSGGLGRIDNLKSPLPIVEVPPTGSNLQRMATAMLESFADRRLHLFDDDDLKRDLSRMRVVEKSYGFRIESPRDASGHGDMGSAFQLALLAASELAAKRKVNAGTMETVDADKPLSPFARAMRDAEARAAAFEQEQAEWLRGEDHQHEFREAMRAAGRQANLFE